MNPSHLASWKHKPFNYTDEYTWGFRDVGRYSICPVWTYINWKHISLLKVSDGKLISAFYTPVPVMCKKIILKPTLFSHSNKQDFRGCKLPNIKLKGVEQPHRESMEEEKKKKRRGIW